MAWSRTPVRSARRGWRAVHCSADARRCQDRKQRSKLTLRCRIIGACNQSLGSKCAEMAMTRMWFQRARGLKSFGDLLIGFESCAWDLTCDM